MWGRVFGLTEQTPAMKAQVAKMEKALHEVRCQLGEAEAKTKHMLSCKTALAEAHSSLTYVNSLLAKKEAPIIRKREKQRQQIEKERKKQQQRLEKEREKQRQQAEKAREQVVELRAAAAAGTEEQRKVGASVKRRLDRQSWCPYCGGSLGADSHADHIYPVGKGRRSIPKNMVYVCAECNTKKGSLTLQAFIREFNLDRETIESRLEELGKDF